MPIPEPDRRPGTAQVNVRVTLAEREELAAAAHTLGAKPTTLARMLILNGVRKVLAEHAAVYERGRARPRLGSKPWPSTRSRRSTRR